MTKSVTSCRKSKRLPLLRRTTASTKTCLVIIDPGTEQEITGKQEWWVVGKFDYAIADVSGALSSIVNMSLSIFQAMTLVETPTRKHLLGHGLVDWDEKLTWCLCG